MKRITFLSFVFIISSFCVFGQMGTLDPTFNPDDFGFGAGSGAGA